MGEKVAFEGFHFEQVWLGSANSYCRPVAAVPPKKCLRLGESLMPDFREIHPDIHCWVGFLPF